MEDLITDYILQLKELHSLIHILQKAVQNENDSIAANEIDNLLEVAIDKINTLLKNANEIMDSYSLVKLEKSL